MWRSPQENDKAAHKKPLAQLPSSSSESMSGIQHIEQQATISTPPPCQHVTTKVSDFTDDTELQERIMALARSEDDPPLLFAWNVLALEAFWMQAVSYATLPNAVPIPINGGNLGVAFDVAFLQTKLLEFVILEQLPANPLPTVIGRTLGLACSVLQSMETASVLGRLELHDWFAAVLQHGPLLPGRLATIWTPRPHHNPSGLCVQVLIRGAMWV